ncbi:hypothetical protein MMC25_006942 [Agyrium rufum]|nr:hypothetical protein [Agyrium rufum]
MVKTEVYLRHLALELKDAASAYTYAKYILSPDDPAWLRFMILAFEGKETDAGLELGFQYLSKSLRKPNIESTSADKKSMTDSKGHKLETVSAKAAIDSFLVGLSPQAIFGTEDASTDELPSSGSKLLTKAEITATARAPRACLALALLLRSQNHMNQSYMWLNKLYKIRSQKMLAAWYANVWSERLRYPFIYGDGEVPKTWCLEGLAEDWIKEERLIRAQRRQEEEKARKYKK